MKFELNDGNGVVQEFQIDADRKGNIIVNTRLKEDVSEIIEDNKKQQLERKQVMGKGTQTSMYKMGQLSNLQVYNLIQQGVFFNDKALRRWFNDLDNYLWRTTDKKRKGGQVAVQSLQNPR